MGVSKFAVAEPLGVGWNCAEDQSNNAAAWLRQMLLPPPLRREDGIDQSRDQADDVEPSE